MYTFLTNSVYREGQEETKVPLLDIITVQALEDQNNEGAGFCLHYSLLGDKHMRTHAKVDFRFRDEGLATNWTETLKKRHNNASMLSEEDMYLTLPCWSILRLRDNIFTSSSRKK